jgi:hypothetical protein
MFYLTKNVPDPESEIRDSESLFRIRIWDPGGKKAPIRIPNTGFAGNHRPIIIFSCYPSTVTGTVPTVPVRTLYLLVVLLFDYVLSHVDNMKLYFTPVMVNNRNVSYVGCGTAD